MSPKEIMKMDPEARLALEARARVGDVEAVADWVLFSAWRSILSDKYIPREKKAGVFNALCKSIIIKVER
jgi:hypothetical protein